MAAGDFFRASACGTSACGPLVIHDNYLINLASPDRVMRARRSIQAFTMNSCGAACLGLIFWWRHPGCCMAKRDAQDDFRKLRKDCEQAARGLPKLGDLRLLIEKILLEWETAGGVRGYEGD